MLRLISLYKISIKIYNVTILGPIWGGISGLYGPLRSSITKLDAIDASSN